MNYNKQLDKVLGIVFARYRSVTLERKDGYWICLGTRCQTLKDVDELLNGAAESLQQSINRVKNV